MFSPADQALDLTSRITTSRLLKSPLDEGTWALLEPAGRQNHAPQLCWLDPDRLACVWMAGAQEGTAGMNLSQRAKTRQESLDSTTLDFARRDALRAESPPLCHGRRAAALNTLLSELGILKIVAGKTETQRSRCSGLQHSDIKLVP